MEILDETDLISEAVKLYVAFENNKKYKSRKEYYTAFSERLYIYLNRVYRVQYSETIENKRYSDMFNKFYKETVTKNQLSPQACFDFGKYFYQKFLPEIKRHRLFVQGSKYSTNKKAFEDVRQ